MHRIRMATRPRCGRGGRRQGAWVAVSPRCHPSPPCLPRFQKPNRFASARLCGHGSCRPRGAAGRTAMDQMVIRERPPTLTASSFLCVAPARWDRQSRYGRWGPALPRASDAWYGFRHGWVPSALRAAADLSLTAVGRVYTKPPQERVVQTAGRSGKQSRCGAPRVHINFRPYLQSQPNLAPCFCLTPTHHGRAGIGASQTEMERRM